MNAVGTPVLLARIGRAWLRLGDRLHRVTSPVVLGALYFLVFTPVALLLRAVGRDALRRRFEPSARSYWTSRQPGPGTGGYADPF